MKYQLKLEPSNVSYDVLADLSILDSSILANVFLDHGCKQGDCGNCKAKLISGSVRTSLDEEIKDGEVLTCMSYPTSDLVLQANFIPELSQIKVLNLPCKVSNIQIIKEQYLMLTFKIPPNSNFKFLPGQYIDLSYQGVTRSYSIASLLSSENTFDLHIRLYKNGEFSQLLKTISLAQTMRFSGPKGTFFIRQSEKRILLLASGTGMAPIHAMVQNLIEKDDKRKIFIYWRMRQGKHFYLENLFQSSEYENIKFIPYISESDPNWCGRFGSMHDILALDFLTLENFSVYVCGSTGFIEEAKSTCFNLNLEKSQFYSDLFVKT